MEIELKEKLRKFKKSAGDEISRLKDEMGRKDCVRHTFFLMILGILWSKRDVCPPKK